MAPHPDGTIGVPDGYFNPELERLAHAHGVKLLMSAGGEAENADNWVSIATHPAYLDRYLTGLGRLLDEHHYDGFDVDWEPAPLTFPEGKAYTSFLKALRGRFPKAVITVALPAGEYWVSHFAWPDVMANVDYVNAMTYDYAGGWGGVAGHGSNLYPPADYPPTPGYNADDGIRNLLGNHHLDPKKVLMGVTFWGYRFRADHIGGKFPVNGRGYADNLCLAQVVDLLRTGHYQEQWDAGAAMPYLERTGGGSVVCYENPESIRRKCEYAKAAGCAGMMIWSLGADVCGDQAPLMDAVAQASGGKAVRLDRSAVEGQIDTLGETLAHRGPRSRSATRLATRGGPSTSSSLSREQLDERLAQLRQADGLLVDQLWRDADPRK